MVSARKTNKPLRMLKFVECGKLSKWESHLELIKNQCLINLFRRDEI